MERNGHRMVQIDEELLRKRAEHNDRSLRNLEEISLHQQNIEGINRWAHPRDRTSAGRACVSLWKRVQGVSAHCARAHAHARNPRHGKCILRVPVPVPAAALAAHALRMARCLSSTSACRRRRTARLRAMPHRRTRYRTAAHGAARVTSAYWLTLHAARVLPPVSCACALLSIDHTPPRAASVRVFRASLSRATGRSLGCVPSCKSCTCSTT